MLPAGFQLERARSLLADPGDITIDDIKEFISLSSAREQVARARAARNLRNTRSAMAAVVAVTIIAAAVVGYLQWDKARQLRALQNSLNKLESQSNPLK